MTYSEFVAHSLGNQLAGIAVGVMQEQPCELPTFAWPGGYECFYMTAAGDELCAKCAQKQVDERIEAVIEIGPAEARTAWWSGDSIVAGIGHMDEVDSCIMCAECNRFVEASGCETVDGRTVHGEYCSYGKDGE